MNRWTHKKQRKTEKKRKFEEGKEGKVLKPSDDAVYLRRDIMEAFKRSDEKMENYSRKANGKMESYARKVDEKQKETDERLDNYAKKAEDMMDKFLQITSSVGTQLQGMNSSIVKNERRR